VKRQVTGELYFTAPHLAARCVEFVAARCDLASFDLIVEPSAGEGVFLSLLPADRRIGLDISPAHPEITQADFLSWRPGKALDRILTIGNPPFGQRAAIAVDFIQHAASFSDTIAFILPRSFNKYTFQNRVPREFHLLDSFDCDDFCDPQGSACKVSAVFQIWYRQTTLRDLVVLPSSHPDFEMCHAHLSRISAARLSQLRTDYEFTVPQVGSDFRPRAVDSVTKGSHWFIKPKVPGVKQRFELLDFSFLDGMNTAHKSLSRKDIVAAYAEQR